MKDNENWKVLNKCELSNVKFRVPEETAHLHVYIN